MGATMPVSSGGHQYFLLGEVMPMAALARSPAGIALSIDFERKSSNTPLDSKRRTMTPRHPLEPDLLRGSIDLLVLKALSLEPMHGWGIGQRIQALSRDAFTVNQGTLYPTLERLLRAGMIAPEWRTTENNRRARYYRITRSGHKHLEAERQEWERSSRAIELILRTT